jgi:hypothetical protein
VTTARRGRAALGIALAAAVLIAPSCSARHTGPAATAAPSPTPSPASSIAPTPTAAPLAVAMRQWEALAGEHFTQSGLALQQVSEASAADDEAALQSGCYKLHDANTVGLQHDLPTPDPRLTDELQRMIDDINTATHACVRFVLARDAADSAVYQDYLARSVEHLHRAKGFLNEDLAPK